LLEYIKKTDEASSFPEFQQMMQQLEGRFHVLSRYVHVHSREFIPYPRSARFRLSDGSALQSVIEHATDLWPILTALFIAFFPNKYVRANHSEKRVIAATLGPVATTQVKTYLREMSIRSD
jgi:hypothetical protein